MCGPHPLHRGPLGACNSANPRLPHGRVEGQTRRPGRAPGGLAGSRPWGAGKWGGEGLRGARQSPAAKAKGLCGCARGCLRLRPGFGLPPPGKRAASRGGYNNWHFSSWHGEAQEGTTAKGNITRKPLEGAGGGWAGCSPDPLRQAAAASPELGAEQPRAAGEARGAGRQDPRQQHGPPAAPGGQCWAGGASRAAHVLQAAGLAQCWLLRPHACPRPRKVFTGDKSGTDLIP